MFDLFEDTVKDDNNPIHYSLELERIKEKLKNIWNMALQSHCTSMDITDEEKAQYIKDNQLRFTGETEDHPNELDSVLEMLDQLMNLDSELNPVESEETAPSYSGSLLSSYTESSKVPNGSDNSSHPSTITSSDSHTKLSTGFYDKPRSNKLSRKTDFMIVTVITPLFTKVKDELLDLKSRQSIGKRRQLFR